MFAALARLVLRHRAAVIALLLAATALAAFSARSLRADFTFTSFLGSRDPEFVALERARERWGADDTTLTVVASLREGRFTSDPGIAALRDVERALRACPAVKAARSFASFPVVRGSPGLVEVSEAGDLDATERAALARDPLVVPALLSADGRSTAILLELQLPGDDILSYRPAVRAVRGCLAEAAAARDLEVAIAGIPAVRADLVENILAEQSWFVGLSMLAAGLVLLLLFRRLHALFACAVAAALPAVWLLGVMAATDEPFGLLSQVYPALIPVIAIADAIHLITRFHDEARASLTRGLDLRDAEVRRAAIVDALHHTGPACLTTTLTTAIGFGSLAVADMPVLRHFGLYAAVGCAFAFVSVVVAVPLALDLARQPPLPAERAGEALRRLALASTRRPLLVTGLCLALGLGGALVASQVSIDNRLGDSLVKGGEIDRAQGVVDASLGGVLSFQIELEGPAGSLFSPELLAAQAKLVDDLRATEPTRWVAGHVTVLRRLNAAFTGQPGPPGSAALAEQLLAVAGAEDQMAGFVDDERAHGRLIVGLPDIGGRNYEAYEARVRALLDEVHAAHPGLTLRVTGVVPIAYRGFNRLSGELASSLGLAAVVIALVLLVMFKSAWICLISAPPNLLPLLFTLALMGLLGWKLDPAATVVFSVALGIAVDDTIHVLARVRERLGEGRAVEDAIVGAVSTTGRALLTTSVLLGVSFAVFSISSFPIPRVFGSLMATAIGAALLLDLTLLPALLSLGQRAVGARQRLRGASHDRPVGAPAEAEAHGAARPLDGDAHGREDG